MLIYAYQLLANHVFHWSPLLDVFPGVGIFFLVGAQVDKFEQVSSDYHQMSVAGGRSG